MVIPNWTEFLTPTAVESHRRKRPEARMVLHVAAALVAIEAGANLEGIGKGDVDHRLQALEVIVAGRPLDKALEIVGRLLGNQDHRAARRVAAEQRALRALEHLDVLQVEE